MITILGYAQDAAVRLKAVCTVLPAAQGIQELLAIPLKQKGSRKAGCAIIAVRRSMGLHSATSAEAKKSEI